MHPKGYTKINSASETHSPFPIGYKSMEAQNIKLYQLRNNSGQVEGLPNNPRLIKDDRFKKLVKSLQDDPEMLSLRELIVFPHKDTFVVIGGNMRLKALRELGYTEAPCKVLPADTHIEKLKAIALKDNSSFGDYDYEALANEWDAQLLADCGIEVWQMPEDIEKELEEEEQKKDSAKSQKIILRFNKKEFLYVRDALLSLGETFEEAVVYLLKQHNGEDND